MRISHHIFNVFIYFVLIIYITDTAKVLNPIFANWTNTHDEKHKKEYDENQDFIKPNETHLKGVPKFIEQPTFNHYFVYPFKPIEIVCVAQPTNYLTIFCNKKHYNWQKGGRDYSSNVQGHMDLTKELGRISIIWKYEDVDKWTKNKTKSFTCHCQAWNMVMFGKTPTSKKIQSNLAVIKKGYLNSNFKKIPQSTTVKLGQRIILSCVPPDGNPIPVIGWLKDGIALDQSNSNKRIKLEEGHFKLMIDSARLSDSGNYSCKAITSVKELLSPIAVVRVENKTKNFWTPWSKWENCDKNCRKKRSRSCLPSLQCFGIREQISDCTDTECKESYLTSSIRESNYISMYIGLFVSVTILVMVVTIVFCLIRRKVFAHFRSSLQYPLDINDNEFSLESKSSSVKNQQQPLFYNASGNNINPHHTSLLQQLSSSNTPISSTVSQSTMQKNKQVPHRRYNPTKNGTPSPPSLPPPNCFSDSETTTNNTSNYPFQFSKKPINPTNSSHCCLHNPGIDLSTFNTNPNNTMLSTNCVDHHKFGQPLISNSSSVTNTSNRSKNTFSSTTSAVNDNLPESKEPLNNSRPISALYNDISLNYEYPDADNDGDDDDNDSENIEIDNSNIISDDLSLLDNERANISHLSMGKKDPNQVSSSFTCALLNGSVGGRLALPNSGISLTVSANSFTSHSGNSAPNTQLYLSVVRNELYPPILNDSETLLSPIVLFGPDTTDISKPCVLTLPHSADLRQGNWVIRLVTSSIDPNTTNNPKNWQIVSTIGCENDQTPIYTHLDPFQAFIMLNRPQKVCLIGQSYPGGKAIKRLRLGVFGQPMKQTVTKTNFNIRIYVFSDTKESFERITSLEMSIGGCLLDNTQQIMFNDCVGNNLLFCIEELSNGWCNQLTAKYQEIPFKDVWCTGSIADNIHCAFTFDNIDPGQYHNLMARITIYQSGFYNNRRTVTVRQDRTITNNNNYLKYYSHPGNTKPSLQYDKVLLHSESNNNYLDPLNTIFRIPCQSRKKLCVLLDSINTRGNDWRNLYRQLGLNGYMNYFVTQSSPTDALLTLWEAKNRNESALLDLINCLKSINRLDCAAILEADYSS